jgi:hypothetical protein
MESTSAARTPDLAYCRQRLLGVAYAILGDLGESEDVVQDAWLRWQAADRDEILNAEAFLVTVATRLAIDRQRSARVRREIAFLLAAQRGDVDQLRELLAADAIQYSDGGGKGSAARKPIYGAEKIAGFYAAVRRTGRFPRDLVARPVVVNGDPGVRLVGAAGELYAITALQIADGQVLAIRNFINPERFGSL